MYSAFHGIIGQLAAEYGAPYDTFPSLMMGYGGGGVGGVGTICGALNGACAAFGLFAKTKADRTALIKELCLWYEKTALPIATPKKPWYTMAMPKNKAGSPLCHISLTEWCAKSKYKVGGTAHGERCHRLTGDVAVKATQMLNDYLAGKFAPTLDINTFSKGCMACHGAGTAQANAYAKMNCDTCHDDPHK